MKVILYMATSINGFISRKDDSTHWSDGELKAYIDKVKSCGNLVVGRKTYEIMQSDTDGDSDSEVLGNPQIVVITKNKSLIDKEKVKFVNSPREAIIFLKKTGFKEVLVAGGSKNNSAFLSEGLIDEIFLDIEPKVFGDGTPFLVPSNIELDLKLIGIAKIGDQTVQLHYQVLK